MDSMISIDVYKTPLRERVQAEYTKLLGEAGLNDEGDAELVALARDDAGRAVGCGTLAGHTIKQLAVSQSMEGSGVMAGIMTRLKDEAVRSGVARLFLCTKPENLKKFESLGFHSLVRTSDALLMENRRGGLDSFLARVRADADAYITKSGSAGILRGAVVCNCDPFTLGHRGLIEYAARNCDFLYIFAVSERGSMFSPDERLQMIREGTKDIANCRVYGSELYLVSRATFPAYFIRDEEHADEVRSDIDIAIFTERIAPALGITRRFVGEEPFSPVTRSYNERMKVLLPERGISLDEIPRVRMISAGRVRSLIREGRLEDVRELVPETTYAICLKFQDH